MNDFKTNKTALLFERQTMQNKKTKTKTNRQQTHARKHTLDMTLNILFNQFI
jgi:hypothetical protein